MKALIWKECHENLNTPPSEAVLLALAAEHSIHSTRRNGGREVQPPLFLLVVGGQTFNPLGAGVGASIGTILAYRGLILLSAIACALTCYQLARRCSLSYAGCIVWLLCGLVFGPVSLLLMLAVQEWTARVACPSCDKPRVVSRDTFERCGARHALPLSDGTEIIEPTTVAPLSI
jgi:hypothetical protein